MKATCKQLPILFLIFAGLSLMNCGSWNIADELVTTDPITPDGSIMDPLNTQPDRETLYRDWDINILPSTNDKCDKTISGDVNKFFQDRTDTLTLAELTDETDLNFGNCVAEGGFQYSQNYQFLTECIASGNFLHMDETWVYRYLRCIRKVNVSTNLSVDENSILTGSATGNFEYSQGCLEVDQTNKDCVFSFDMTGTPKLIIAP